MASKSVKHDIASELNRYNDEELRIVLVGKTGVGKSASGNTILGVEVFESEFSFHSVTERCHKAHGEVDEQRVSVIDTPGLFDTSTDEGETVKNIVQCISYASPGPHIFLIVIKLGRYSEEEKKTVQKIQKTFGREADKYSMVLFTHGDQLKGKPIEKCLEESEDLQELVAKCNGQYHVFENKLKDHSQVRGLLNKIRKITEKNGGSHYTTEMFQKAENLIEERKHQILREEEEKIHKHVEELEKKLMCDREKENHYSSAREREMEEEIKKLKEMQERQAREKAESSGQILQMLFKLFEQALPYLFDFLKEAYKK